MQQQPLVSDAAADMIMMIMTLKIEQSCFHPRSLQSYSNCSLRVNVFLTLGTDNLRDFGDSDEESDSSSEDYGNYAATQYKRNMAHYARKIPGGEGTDDRKFPSQGPTSPFAHFQTRTSGEL